MQRSSIPWRPRTPRRALLVAALTLTGAVLTTAPSTAAEPAATARAADDQDDFTPWLDYAGSQIAKHEGGTQNGPNSTLAAPAGAWRSGVRGHDVSSHQGNIDWAAAKRRGAAFVYVKATEATTYKNPYYDQQSGGARSQGILHGAYHFALPDRSSGTAQARWFTENGGFWEADGKTLPPALDLEYNPYGADCYGLSASAMRSWIRDFSDEVQRRTGRSPVIYTTTTWWRMCTGDSSAFADNPLWIAWWSASVGALPASWDYWSFWQYASAGALPGDQNVFNGPSANLGKFARG